MWPDGVVVTAPGFDDDSGLSAGAKPLHREALVAQLAVEALIRAVLPRLAGFDVRRVDLGVGDPLQDGARYELRPIVRSNDLRCAMPADQTAQHFDDPHGANGAGHIDGQALPGVLVDDRQALEFLAVGTGVEDEIIGPDLVAHAGCQWPGTSSRHALHRPLAGHLEAGHTPEPVAALDAHRMTFSGKEYLDAPVAVARVLGSQLAHSCNGWGISLLQNRLVPQRGSRNGKQRARSPL